MQSVIISGKFLSNSISGIPRYAFEVLKRLDKRLEDLDVFLCCPKNLPKEKLPALHHIEPILYGKDQTGWNLFCLDRLCRKKKALLVNFASNGTIYRDSVVCLHDIRPITWDEQNGVKTKHSLHYKLNFKFIIKNAKQIVTVSEFSQKEIKETFAYNKKIEIAPAGWEHLNDIPKIQKPKNDFDLLENAYYFSIGSVAPHKNFNWIVQVAKRNPNDLFLIAGGIYKEIWDVDIDLSELPNVKFLGYIKNEEMKWYMEHAKALLFPSLYEGFGSPPLEALALETDVIAMDLPIMREIYKDSLHYIYPQDYDVDLDALLQQPVQGREEVLEKYTWENCAAFWEAIIRENCRK